MRLSAYSGGSTWSGSGTCVAGSTCNYVNDFYSQVSSQKDVLSPRTRSNIEYSAYKETKYKIVEIKGTAMSEPVKLCEVIVKTLKNQATHVITKCFSYWRSKASSNSTTENFQRFLTPNIVLSPCSYPIGLFAYLQRMVRRPISIFYLPH